MNKDHQCPKCGQPVPSDAPEGLCPRCLGALNLDSETGVTGVGAAAATPPPSALELAPHFPQLEILEVLGRGGMGVVYKVRQKELDRIAALKILPPGIGGDPAFAERFAREAKALARLNHPGIVTIYDSGRTDGLYYFLMEFVDGVSLGRLMHGGRVSPREALAIVPQICDALQYAHDQGIVHRDIKPENILLDRQGRVKVADFGLAKLVAGTEQPLTPSLSPSDGERVLSRLGEGRTPALTDAGKVMGTPAYMAPEQAAHPAAVDHRADIYALGVVFYQMLTGELPGQRLEPPSKKVQIDVRLDEVVLRALEKKPELRYQQVSVLKTQVETIAASTASGVQSAPAPTESWEAARRRVSPLASALLVLGVVQLILSVLVTVRGFSADSVDLGFGLFGSWRLFLPEPWGPALAMLAPYFRALNLLVVLSALRMRRLESYGLAITSAALAMIIPPLLPIGLPLGVWALIILARKEIRREFGRLIPASCSGSPGPVPSFSKLAIASLILTIVTILTSSLFAGVGLFDPLVSLTSSAGLVQRLVSSAFIWAQAWPSLGTALLAAIALEDIRCGHRCLKGAGLATFALLFLPLGTGGIVVLLHVADSSNFHTQWAGFSLLSIVVAVVLSAGAAFWVQVHEARRWRAGQTGAAMTWWLLSKPAVRCLQVMALVLPLANAYLLGHFAYFFEDRLATAGSGVEAAVSQPQTRALPGEPNVTNEVTARWSADSTGAQPGASGLSSLLQFRWVAAEGDTDSPADLLTDDSQQTLRVLREVVLTSDDVESAEFAKDQSDRKQLVMVLTLWGGQKLAKTTAAHIGRQLAIVWNGRVISAPVVLAAFPGRRLTINGRFNEAEAKQLLDLLNHRAAATTPTVDQILAHYARAKGSMAGPDKTRTLAVKGTFTSRDRLGTMEAEMLIKAPDKWTQILKGTNGIVWQRAFDGSVAWEASPWSGPAADPASVALAPYLIALVRGDSLAPLLPKMSLKGREPIGGGQAYVVEVAVLGQAPRLWFDTQTGLLVRIECVAGSAVLQMDWGDYRDVGGLMVPFKVREAGTENWIIQCTEVKRNEPIDDSRFKRPASH